MAMKVELNEDYVHHLRRERMKKHRRTLTGSSGADLLNNSGMSGSLSPMKGRRPPSSDSRVRDARSAGLRGYERSSSVSPAKSPGVLPMAVPMERHRRTESTDSTRFQVKLTYIPRTAYLQSS